MLPAVARCQLCTQRTYSHHSHASHLHNPCARLNPSSYPHTPWRQRGAAQQTQHASSGNDVEAVEVSAQAEAGDCVGQQRLVDRRSSGSEAGTSGSETPHSGRHQSTTGGAAAASSSGIEVAQAGERLERLHREASASSSGPDAGGGEGSSGLPGSAEGQGQRPGEVGAAVYSEEEWKMKRRMEKKGRWEIREKRRQKERASERPLPPELLPAEVPRRRYIIFAEVSRKDSTTMILKELRGQGQCLILAPADPDIVMALRVLKQVQATLAASNADSQLLVKVTCSPDVDEDSPYFAQHPAQFALLFHIVCSSSSLLGRHLERGLPQPCTLTPSPATTQSNYLRVAYHQRAGREQQWKSKRHLSARMMQELATHGAVQLAATSVNASLAAVRCAAMVTDALCTTRSIEVVLAVAHAPGAAGRAQPTRSVFTLLLACGVDPALHSAQLRLLWLCYEREQRWRREAEEAMQGRAVGRAAAAGRDAETAAPAPGAAADEPASSQAEATTGAVWDSAAGPSVNRPKYPPAAPEGGGDAAAAGRGQSQSRGPVPASQGPRLDWGSGVTTSRLVKAQRKGILVYLVDPRDLPPEEADQDSSVEQPSISQVAQPPEGQIAAP